MTTRNKDSEGTCSLKVEPSPGLLVMTLKPAPLTREQVIQKRSGLEAQKSELLARVAELDRQIKEVDEWLDTPSQAATAKPDAEK